MKSSTCEICGNRLRGRQRRLCSAAICHREAKRRQMRRLRGPTAPRGAYVRYQGPGLARMRDRTPDGLCPFCLAELPRPNAKHCGDEECERAYHRTHQRDRRRGLLVAQQRVHMPRRKK